MFKSKANIMDKMKEILNQNTVVSSHEVLTLAVKDRWAMSS